MSIPVAISWEQFNPITTSSWLTPNDLVYFVIKNSGDTDILLNGYELLKPGDTFVPPAYENFQLLHQFVFTVPAGQTGTNPLVLIRKITHININQ
ncbi:MAG: hypothetical protein R3279_07465 [Putridiphycobacter sp.]|nr:hypothetical protein [Putridiphycobacter sp.]